MKTLKTICLGLALAGSLSLQAVPITGTVDMSGTVFLDNTLLGSANAATAFTGVVVGGIPTGSFTGTAGDSVTWAPFAWNPSSTPVGLWTYTDAVTGFTYKFKLDSVGVVSQSNTFLNLLGEGVLSITGPGSPYEDTGGDWSFTISNPNGGAHANFAFTFANSQTTIPDGGATVMLTGLGLLGLGALRRKVA